MPSPRGLAGVAVLLWCFVMLRGLTLATVQMPFEGWDEYAHVAVAAHVALYRQMPQPTDDVPDVLWDFLRRHPHPPGSAAHCAGLGAQRYDQWAVEPLPPLEDPRPPPLYQAQQGPLFYHLMALLWRGAEAHGLSVWTDTGRALNVVCVATGAVCWLYALAVCLGPGGRPLAVGASMAAAANSLVLYNSVRVANDALALCLAGMAFLLYACTLRRTAAARWPLLWAAAVGSLLGAAALAKMNALAMLPVVLLGACLARPHARSRIATGLALVAGYALVAGWYHLASWRGSGAFVPMQEAVHNAQQGRHLFDILMVLPQLDWPGVRDMLILETLRGGGWSGLPLPGVFTAAYRTLLLVGVLGTLLVLLQPRRRRALLMRLRAAWELPVLVLMIWCALLFHAAQSQAAWGYPTTGARYGVLALPALFTLVLLGLAHLSPRLLLLGTAVMTVLFSGVYYVETFGDLVPFQTVGLATGMVAGIAEIQAHHSLLQWPVLPSVLGEGVFLLGLFGCLAADVAPDATGAT